MDHITLTAFEEELQKIAEQKSPAPDTYMGRQLKPLSPEDRKRLDGPSVPNAIPWGALGGAALGAMAAKRLFRPSTMPGRGLYESLQYAGGGLLGAAGGAALGGWSNQVRRKDAEQRDPVPFRLTPEGRFHEGLDVNFHSGPNSPGERLYAATRGPEDEDGDPETLETDYPNHPIVKEWADKNQVDVKAMRPGGSEGWYKFKAVPRGEKVAFRKSAEDHDPDSTEAAIRLQQMAAPYRDVALRIPRFSSVRVRPTHSAVEKATPMLGTVGGAALGLRAGGAVGKRLGGIKGSLLAGAGALAGGALGSAGANRAADYSALQRYEEKHKQRSSAVNDYFQRLKLKFQSQGDAQ